MGLCCNKRHRRNDRIFVLFCALCVSGLLFAAGEGIAAERSAALNAAMNSITADDLIHHVDVLADDSFEGREAGSRGGRAAGGYLVKLFQKHGLQPAGEDGGYFQSFEDGSRNILGILPGSDPQLKNEYLILGAHYDHVGYGRSNNSFGPTGYIHNGADDNASGVSGLLEAIEAFTVLGDAPQRSVLFALWDGEEKGLLGSKHWVNSPTVPLDSVVMMINTDMIGRMKNNKITIFGTRTRSGLRRLVSRHNDTVKLDIDFPWNIKANSDHHPFFAKGVPILMWHTGLHEDYHRPSDDAHKLNTEGMQKSARLLFSVAQEIANQDSLKGFRDQSRSETILSRQRFEKASKPLDARFGVAWKERKGDELGRLLTHVTSESAADKAGLKVGDRLVKFAGQVVGDEGELRTAILSAAAPVKVVVDREGEKEPITVTVKLAGQPVRMGVAWREDEAEPGTVLLSRVTYGSPAHRAGLKVQDRIYSISGHNFKDGDELYDLINTLPNPIEFQVERKGTIQPIIMNLPPKGPSKAESSEAIIKASE